MCEGVSIQGYSGTLCLHGWRSIYDFIYVMSIYHVRACKSPGNLDTTVSNMGGSLGYIWLGGVGQVSEN